MKPKLRNGKEMNEREGDRELYVLYVYVLCELKNHGSCMDV